MYDLLPDIDPFEVLPYSADFSNFLDADDSISSATVITSPSDLQTTTPQITGSVVTVFCSHGTLGSTYTISFEIVSANGWHSKRSGIINCSSR